MRDTWFTRDAVVLDAVVQHLDEFPEVTDHDIEIATGFDSDTVQRALRALRDVYVVPFTGTEASGPIQYIADVTPRARTAVGAWPTPESLADAIDAALRDLAAREPNDAGEVPGRAKAVVRALGSSGRDVLVGVAAALLSGTIT